MDCHNMMFRSPDDDNGEHIVETLSEADSIFLTGRHDILALRHAIFFVRFFKIFFLHTHSYVL